ncbi:MAG TPA: methyltransferase domain-containing protein [Aliidongia sp.]|nr:methyltransferase domain-containing protein [Aliidongia sp.]
MTDQAAAPKADVVFSASMHLRLLLRVDRTESIRRALRTAIRPGARVLDAGCGSGLLSFLGIEAGAAEVVAVDRDNIDLAKALARENGMADRIRFIEADLATLEDPSLGKFDALLAFVYSNHIVVDEPRSRMVAGLRHRFGKPDAVTVPDRVRYWAIPCDWPAQDGGTERAELRQAVADIENRYGLKLSALEEAVAGELAFMRSRPKLYGDYKWQPGGGSAYRHARTGGRFLGERVLAAEICYDRGEPFRHLPDSTAVAIDAAGSLNAVLWVQELSFQDRLIWSAEAFSPVAIPPSVRAGDRLTLRLDEDWRATNLISVAPA